VEARPPEFTKDGKVTARYTKWLEKCRQYQQVQHFNLDSNSHLKWLFFDRMRLPVLERTEKGEPSVGKKTLNKMGGVAKILLEYRSQRDVRKFLTSLEENQIDGKFRPSYKVVGTVSSRLSCGDA
jgi:DNA polymerase-1